MHKKVIDVARTLADAHAKEDPETHSIFLSMSDDANEVRLVEFSGSLAPSGQVLPFRFNARPDQGIDFPSVIVLLSPSEEDLLREGKLTLPPGWGDFSKLLRLK